MHINSVILKNGFPNYVSTAKSLELHRFGELDDKQRSIEMNNPTQAQYM